MPAISQSGSQLCEMPCLNTPTNFKVPPPGANQRAFMFHRDGNRELFLIMPRNHSTHPIPSFNPKIALVGLSPAGTQIQGFLDRYSQTGDYDAAARWASFRGLEKDIVGMLSGLGAEKFLGLSISGITSFSGHPDILTNSLVKCASLAVSGSSDDFDPTAYQSNIRCITHRFFGEITNPQFTRLSHVFVFGDKAHRALKSITLPDGRNVWRALEDSGRQIIGLPHPSGQNGEYVALTKLPSNQFPDQDVYAETKWNEYAAKPPRKQREKQAESAYKAKRRTYWAEVSKLRKLFSPKAA